MTPSDEEISKLIGKKLVEGLSQEEEQYLSDWINKSDDNRYTYIRTVNKQNVKKYLIDALEIDLEENLAEIKAKIRKIKRRKLVIRLLSYAASAVMVASLGLYIYKYDSKKRKAAEISAVERNYSRQDIITPSLIFENGVKLNLSDNLSKDLLKEKNIDLCNDSTTIKYTDKNVKEEKTEINKIVVPRGGEYNFYLSDGTHVFLNSQSEIEFPVAFRGNSREVKISGEVYFKVAKNKAKPFIVHSDIVDIRVTGTEFNVKSYPEDKSVQATLVEGGIRLLYGKDRKQEVDIVPSHQAEIMKNSHEVEIKKVNTEIYTSWMRRRFVFDKQSLDEIMKILSRWYGIEVFFQNDEIREMQFSGYFDRYESIEPILEIIETTRKVKIEKKNKTVVLKKR